MRTASVGTYFKKDESGEKASEIRPSGPEWRSLRESNPSFKIENLFTYGPLSQRPAEKSRKISGDNRSPVLLTTPLRG
jgi:hypothetical protein